MDVNVIFKLNGTDLSFNDSDVIEANFSLLNSSLPTLEFHEPVPYFGEYLKTFSIGYDAVHGYLSFIVCVCGITANLLNIIVLTRKNMVSSINAILTSLAVADLLVMFSYLPCAYHNYIRDVSEKEKHSYGWAVFNLFHAHFTVATHTISAWLTVTVAVWRLIAISFPSNSACWCSMQRAKCAIAATYVTCTVFCIPIYIIFTVSKFRGTDGEILYTVYLSQMSQGRYQLLDKVNFWFFSVMLKLVPCVALTPLSLGLILALYEANKRRQILKHGAESDISHDRTTKMLLIVLLLFLLTEFPAGLLALFSGVLGPEFFDNVYLNLCETLDDLTLINSAVKFVIYCLMCRKFRDTFSYLFISKCKNKQEPSKTVAMISI